MVRNAALLVLVSLACWPTAGLGNCADLLCAALGIEGAGGVELPIPSPAQYSQYLIDRFRDRVQLLRQHAIPADEILYGTHSAETFKMELFDFEADLAPIRAMLQTFEAAFSSAKGTVEYQNGIQLKMDRVQIAFIDKNQSTLKFTASLAENRFRFASLSNHKWSFGGHVDGGWLGFLHTFAPGSPATLWNPHPDDRRNQYHREYMVESTPQTHSLVLTGDDRGAYIVGLRQNLGLEVFRELAGDKPLTGTMHSAPDYFLEEGARRQRAPFTSRVFMDVRYLPVTHGRFGS